MQTELTELACKVLSDAATAMRTVRENTDDRDAAEICAHHAAQLSSLLEDLNRPKCRSADNVVMLNAAPTQAMVDVLKRELVTTSRGGILRAGVALAAAIAEGALQEVRTLEMHWGEPKRKLEIEGSPSDGYGAWFTDTDGNLHTVVTFDHPFAAADWCERNGFAWEVIGLMEDRDPLVELAAWRAAQ